MTKETVFSTRTEDFVQFHIALLKLLREYCDRVAGKQVMTVKEINKERDFFAKKIDLKNKIDKSPEKSAYNILFSVFSYEAVLASIDQNLTEISTKYEPFYSDVDDMREKYAELVVKKIFFLIIKDVLPKIHIDKVSLYTLIMEVESLVCIQNREDIFMTILNTLDLEDLKAWSKSRIKLKFNTINFACNNLTIEEYLTWVIQAMGKIFTIIVPQPVREMQEELTDYLQANVFDPKKILLNNVSKFENYIESVERFYFDVMSNFGKIHPLDFEQRIKSIELILHYLHALREMCIIHKKLKANHSDPDIWRNIAILQSHFAQIIENEYAVLSINETADYYHGTKSSLAGNKGWEPMNRVKQAAQILAKEKWDKGDSATHDEMAKWSLDQLKKNTDYKKIMEDHDKKYVSPNASFKAILKALKEVAPKDRIMGMPGVKKDKG